MTIRILTSCTKEKANDGCSVPLRRDDRLEGEEYFQLKKEKLADFERPAGEMYQGRQHQHLMEGVRVFRQAQSGATVDIGILSALYGLLAEDDAVVPYDCTFADMGVRESRQWADRLNIPSEVASFLARPADLILILLGEEYLRAADLSPSTSFGGNALLFHPKSLSFDLPSWEKVNAVPVSQSDATRFSQGIIWLKGWLARRILEHLAGHPEALDTLTGSKTDVLDMVERWETPLFS